MQSMHFLSRGMSIGRSGLTGPADIPDPPTGRGGRSLRERVRLTLRTGLGTVVGMARVVRLGGQASPWLTVGLGVSTVVMGLLPAVTTSLGRLLINTVVTGIEAHVRHHPAVTSLAVPLPGLALTTPVMSVTAAIIVLAAAQFAVYTVTTVAGAVRNITQQLLQERVSQTVELQIMQQAHQLDLAFFEGSRSYDLLHQARQEASTRSLTMITSSATLVQTAVTFVSMIMLLIGLSPWLALVAVLAPVPAFAADAKYGKKGFFIAQLASPLRRRMEYLTTLVTTDTYAKEVKLFGLGDYFVQRFKLLGQVFYRRQRRVVSARYLIGSAWTSISSAAGSLTFLYVALQAAAGRMSLGDLTLYTSASSSLQTAIQALFQGFSGMYENNLYLENLYQLLAVEPTMRCPAPAAEPAAGPAAPLLAVTPAGQVRGHVVFEHVSFGYPDAEAPALTDVSFEVAPGQTVAVVGRNGAGKSTLIKLLCRMYDPTGGRIVVDGVDIATLDPSQLHRHIGAMFQDFVSYQATAAENIGLGDVARIEDRPAAEQAAGRAGARSLIEDLPAGFDTPLGKWFDQGSQLSGGQWQKVALARAFMRDAPILVLDEPTSALDAVAEHELFNRLAELAAGRTTFYISHRFSTVRRADTILVLDQGALTEEGSHAALMALGGTYASLFTLQAAAYTDLSSAGNGHAATAGHR
jgi:ATP-binding cassette subfamily B protein